MSQFQLYKNNDKSTNTEYPFFVDVQTELLSDLNSRMVIPLTPIGLLGGSVVEKLCPVIRVEESGYVLLTHQMTSVPVAYLKTKVTSLKDLRDEILGAIDFLITGI